MYAGDGGYIGKADDEAWALPDTTGNHRYRRGDRADGADTRLLVTPEQDLDAITELVYLARGYEFRAARRRRRVADVLYAAIGAGMLEAAPAQQVEETAARQVAHQEQERLRQQGRYVGIGLATCQERSAYSATEWWFWYDQPPFPLTSTGNAVPS